MCVLIQYKRVLEYIYKQYLVVIIYIYIYMYLLTSKKCVTCAPNIDLNKLLCKFLPANTAEVTNVTVRTNVTVANANTIPPYKPIHWSGGNLSFVNRLNA